MHRFFGSFNKFTDEVYPEEIIEIADTSGGETKPILDYLQEKTEKLRQESQQRLKRAYWLFLIAVISAIISIVLLPYLSSNFPETAYLIVGMIISSTVLVCFFASPLYLISWVLQRNQPSQFSQKLQALIQLKPSYEQVLEFAILAEKDYPTKKAKGDDSEKIAEEDYNPPETNSLSIRFSSSFDRKLIIKISIIFGYLGFYNITSLAMNRWPGLYPEELRWPIILTITVLCSYVFFYLYNYRKWIEIELDREQITLISPHQEASFLPSQVSLIIGLGGVSFLGLNLLAWDRLFIRTNNETYVIKLGQDSQECYLYMSDLCENALCIPYKGAIRPAVNKELQNNPPIQTASQILFHYFLLDIAIAMAYLLAAVGCSVVATVTLKYFESESEKALKIIIVGAIFAWAAIMSFVNMLLKRKCFFQIREVAQK